MPPLAASAQFPSDAGSESLSRSDYSRIERVPVHQDSGVSPETDARHYLIGLNFLQSGRRYREFPGHREHDAAPKHFTPRINIHSSQQISPIVHLH